MKYFLGGQNQRDQFIWSEVELDELMDLCTTKTTFVVRTKEERDMLQGYLLIYGINRPVIVRPNIIKQRYWSTSRLYCKVKLIST